MFSESQAKLKLLCLICSPGPPPSGAFIRAMPVFRQPEHAKDVVRCCRNHTEEYSGNYALHPLVRKTQMSDECQLGHIRFVSVILGIDECKGQPSNAVSPWVTREKFFRFFQTASSCLLTLQDTNLSFLRVRTAHFQCISEGCHGSPSENASIRRRLGSHTTYVHECH